jgi:hypothetical protein
MPCRDTGLIEVEMKSRVLYTEKMHKFSRGPKQTFPSQVDYACALVFANLSEWVHAGMEMFSQFCFFFVNIIYIYRSK